MGRPPSVSPSPRAPLWAVSLPAWFLNLYRRPIAFVLLLVVLPLLIVCTWLYATNEHQWRRREGDDLLVAAQLAARVLTDELNQTHQIAEAIARRPEFLEAVRGRHRADIAAALHLISEVTPMVEHVAVLDAKGERLADDPHSRTEEPAGDTPLPMQPTVSGVYLRDPLSGEKVVSVSTPIRQGEAFLGVVQVQYRLEDIARWLEKVRIEPSGFVYVVDQHDCLVTYPFQVIPGRPKHVAGWPPVNAEASREGRLIRFTQGQPPRPWTAAVIRLPYGWRAVAQQPDAIMLKPFYELVGSFVLLISLLGATLGLLVLRWAYLHDATLGLLAKQARLLKLSEQARVAATLRQHTLKAKDRPHEA